MKKSNIIILSSVILILIDQISKIWVKLNMNLRDEIHIIPNKIIIFFTENPGFAFGTELPGGDWGKIALTLFRLVFVIAGIVYLYKNVNKKEFHWGLALASGFVLAGAIGNLIDCLFYGMIFSASGYHPSAPKAELFPDAGGYASFLHGQVVDMIWCPIINGTFPSWMPIWGGEPFVFFSPIFNVADSAITVGVFIMILFNKTFFKEEENTPAEITSPREEVITTGEVAENE